MTFAYICAKPDNSIIAHVQLPSRGRCLGLYVNQHFNYHCELEGSGMALQSEPSQNACAFSIVNSFEVIIKIRACLIKRVCKYEAELKKIK